MNYLNIYLITVSFIFLFVISKLGPRYSKLEYRILITVTDKLGLFLL